MSANRCKRALNGLLYIAVQMIPIGLFLGFKPHRLDIYGRGACGICPEAILDNERYGFKSHKSHHDVYDCSTPRPPLLGGFCFL